MAAADLDESQWLKEPFEEGAMAAAAAKARLVAGDHPNAVVIGADTVVTVDGRALGKPADACDADAMLRLLSGREHSVITGVAVISPHGEHASFESSKVWFAEMSDEQIAAYVSTGEPMDKAGAYGIQGRASAFIERIEGCYFNIVGLPLFRLAGMLAGHGVVAWDLWYEDAG